jgi:hypothetical protein
MKKNDKYRFLALVACFAAAFVSKAVDISPFGINADMHFRSAYQSRMRVSEDRPVAVFDIRTHVDVGPLGRVGVMNWNRSSFCNRNADIRRRAFNEVDYAAFWHYDMELTEGVVFSSEFMNWWLTQPQNIEPYCGKKDNSTHEFWYVGSLKNPYLVPSLLVRRGWLHNSWVYFRYGVSKPFVVCDLGTAEESRPLVVSPGVFAETGDNGLFESRFGKKESGNYHTGIGTCIVQVSAKWSVSENLSFHAMLQQFSVVSSDARDRIHGNYHRDLTMFRVGMNLSF